MAKPKGKSVERAKWSDEDLKKALALISENKLSVLAASEQFGIPRRTLRDYIAKNLQKKNRIWELKLFSAKKRKPIL